MASIFTDGNWSQTALGTAAVSVQADTWRLMTIPATGNADNLRLDYRPLAVTSNYIAQLRLDMELSPLTFAPSGVCAVGDGTKWITFGYAIETWNSNSRLWLQVVRWTSSTSGPGTSANRVLMLEVGPVGAGVTIKHWRIRDDGTNVYFEVSRSLAPSALNPSQMGVGDWTTLYSESRTAFLTPAYVGYGGNAWAASTGAYTSYIRCSGLAGNAF